MQDLRPRIILEGTDLAGTKEIALAAEVGRSVLLP